jgi:hypothetical protein
MFPRNVERSPNYTAPYACVFLIFPKAKNCVIKTTFSVSKSKRLHWLLQVHATGEIMFIFLTKELQKLGEIMPQPTAKHLLSVPTCSFYHALSWTRWTHRDRGGKTEGDKNLLPNSITWLRWNISPVTTKCNSSVSRNDLGFLAWQSLLSASITSCIITPELWYCSPEYYPF